MFRFDPAIIRRGGQEKDPIRSSRKEIRYPE
jgi:hypothetical protein